MKHISVADLTIGNDCPLTLIAGPCQLESADHAQMVAGKLKEACDKAGAQFVFKGSFDKANRTSLNAKPALGLDEGLKVLDSVKKQIGVPVITDIHEKEQCEPVAAVVDIMQIPAFLCRQTALLLAAGKTGAAINVKKGQFLAPWDMPNVVTKIESTGNDRILLTERGVSFGYNRLVVDMQSLPEMARTGYPVVMDATHAVAQPGGLGGASGGQREFAPVLARAAVATGIAAVFTETHEDPDNAPCDGPNMIYLDQMPKLIETLMRFDALAKADPIRI
ncbi:3-deoxy-8-phosphooctulonate synthase [Phaeobacter italicus]|jgi:2-dehydro-3-deoxyphosphooctonate aldolase (KDO 8-P synthase)|uniref:2-dehydro-3-deoxyphosphooctonate aldolase n=1 Tax=Phaeobacter italicus TaxID=481446 RepID=A0A0H5DI63_9RHOB|nr:3-deoxy-8-phosphooctulonate synthase [Phaeobacter italicus]EEB72050.1 3-deoxy-8-phosphooctulonate synthase [Ruegeria sp. R11]MEC8574479.1 3-deoxy-8-phosphooctulonate synthase [Pseudomonadota bacterium]MBO9441682.1 3-deoxy-8-phosphooctulonate synthase [Phaeobacter italicus]MBY5976590.1 3-deoxy-8-phosphooctulonate synthase [Phaeobacter italicus]MBY6044758.1 3-deoxy-8-phosphooctulonate synthase [Phaeobacter italicus]